MMILETMILFIFYDDHHRDHNHMGTEKIWELLGNI